MTSKFSLIIPALNESAELASLASNIANAGVELSNVWLIDGGSTDGTAKIASQLGFNVIPSAKGRAKQMNTGALACDGELLVFMHADTRLPTAKPLPSILHSRAMLNRDWGRFDIKVDGKSNWFRIISLCINWRSRLSGIATGDQCIFVRRAAFEAIGGFPDQALMEDIELCKRLLTLSKPLCLTEKVNTSGRRWESYGISKTILLMWRLRFLYWRGVSGDKLANYYR